MFLTNGTLYLLLYKWPRGQSPPVNSLKKTFPSPVWGNLKHLQNLPWWLSGKESACKAEDSGLIPGSGRSPGGGNGTHSSLLAWRIPWTEEPGGLQSMGPQRVRHDWATNTANVFKEEFWGGGKGWRCFSDQAQILLRLCLAVCQIPGTFWKGDFLKMWLELLAV